MKTINGAPTVRLFSSFILHPSAFILHPSAFILHPCKKNPSTSAISRVRFIGGRLRQMRLP